MQAKTTSWDLDQKEEADLEETEIEADLVTGVLEEGEAEADLVEVEDLEEREGLRCMKLLVINAETNAKFHSNLQETNLFFAVIVLEKRAVHQGVHQDNREHLQNNSAKSIRS